jgi:hypothetical protein
MAAILVFAQCASSSFDPMRMIELKLRPRPPLIARSRIDQDFAVLLMRTSYAQAEGKAMARSAAPAPFASYANPGHTT